VPIPVVKVDQNPLTRVIGHLAHDSETNAQKGNDATDAQHLDDLVFENRNQEYGAYVLRKQYLENVYKGLLVTLIVAFIVIFFPAMLKFFKREETIDKAPLRKLVYSELTAPPPIDKPKPPPPQIQLPKLQKVIKFVPPKIVKESVTEEVPTIKELRENETAAVAVDGVQEIVFDEPVAEVVEAAADEVYMVVEQQPEFEGGYEAMLSFIKKNMVYPANARRMQIDGTVHVSFIVSKTGEISDVKVLRGIMTDCDNEAVRVVKMMPRWKPGKQNGKPVYVRFIMPIKFRLN
jgi:protein TonB